MSSAPFRCMSGAINIGGIGIPKPGPDFDRKIPALPPQDHSGSLAIPSNVAVQDANEIFRQGWQAIVASLHAAEQASEDNAPVANSLRAAGAPVSIQEPATDAANEGRATQDTAEGATRELVPDGASIVESIASRPAIVSKASAAQGAVHEDPDRHLSRVRAEDSTAHSPQSSPRSDQFDSQQATDTQTGTVTAPYSDLWIIQPSAPIPVVSQAMEETPPAKSSAPEVTNRKGNSSGRDTKLAGSANISEAPSVTGRRSTGTPVDFKSEEQTTAEMPSSHASPERTGQPLESPDEYVSSHKPTAVVELAKSYPADGPSPQLPLTVRSNAALKSMSPTKSAEATEFTLDPGVQINQSSIGLLKRGAMPGDLARIAETSLNSKAKTAAAPFILSQPASDAGPAPFGQTRGAPAPPSSAIWAPSLSGLDGGAVTPGKTAPARETFAAMDAGMSDGSARWILADSHRAEAGFQDPALGWISVRAQAGAAGIHAAVMPASETAAEVLSSHLVGLNAHMANHYEHMNTVTLSFPGTGWNGTGRELAQQNDRGPSQDNRQQPQENLGPISAEPSPQFANRVQDERTMTDLPVFTAGMSLQERHFSVVV